MVRLADLSNPLAVTGALEEFRSVGRLAFLARYGFDPSRDYFLRLGMPAENNRRGEPILDVDHVKDLALGGEDHPRNMVALCPNCHACKTRGAEGNRWRKELSRIAVTADAAARRPPHPATGHAS